MDTNASPAINNNAPPITPVVTSSQLPVDPMDWRSSEAHGLMGDESRTAPARFGGIEDAVNATTALKKCSDLVGQYKSLFSPLRSGAFYHQLAALKKEVDEPPEYVIAVLGTTGQGKSSTLNALLDEAILPTSGHGGACTATIIKLKYGVNSNYKVDIHFISQVS